MYSTNLWIFSSNLAIALSIYSFLLSFHSFLFSFFLLFWNLHSPLLLMRSSYSLAMLPLYFLSEEHLGRLVSDCPSLVLCRGTNPQLSHHHCRVAVSGSAPGYQLHQDMTRLLLHHSFFAVPHFLLCLFLFLYFTNNPLYTLLSILFDFVLFCCVFLSFIAYLKS